jgi:hypothetical protein
MREFEDRYDRFLALGNVRNPDGPIAVFPVLEKPPDARLDPPVPQETSKRRKKGLASWWNRPIPM